MPLAAWTPLRKPGTSSAGPSPPALWHSRQLSASAGSLASSAFAVNARSVKRRAVRLRVIEVPGWLEAEGQTRSRDEAGRLVAASSGRPDLPRQAPFATGGRSGKLSHLPKKVNLVWACISHARPVFPEPRGVTWRGLPGAERTLGP